MGNIVSMCCEDNKPRIRSNASTPVLKAQNPDTNPSVRKKSFSEPALVFTEIINPTPTSQQKLTFLQEQEEQFYEIQSCIEEREKSNLQPKQLSSHDFEIKGLLGQGAFCNVYLAIMKADQQIRNEQPLAMKKIPKQKIMSRKTKESIKLERNILAASTNRFITALRYAFLDKKYLYIVMEVASAGDASRLIQNHKIREQFLKLGEDGLRFVVACVVLALEYLHTQGIIFRDLKPENVLLFANGYVKLSDFGLAKLFPDKDQKTKTLAGTAVYCSPQMILQVGYNRGVDFWALGVLIYELATGETPYKLQDVSTKLRFKRIAQEEETKRRWRGHSLSPFLNDLVGQLLRFHAQQRLGMNGWDEIKKHRFFFGFDWGRLSEGTMVSPLLQLVKNNPLETKKYRTVPEQSQYNSIDSISSVEQDWNFNAKST